MIFKYPQARNLVPSGKFFFMLRENFAAVSLQIEKKKARRSGLFIYCLTVYLSYLKESVAVIPPLI
jgi:hypothetical protein